MDTRVSNSENKEVYHQSIPNYFLVAIVSSAVATYILFSNYSETGSLTQLILADIFLFIVIVLAKPIVEWRRIEIDNAYITIHKLFFKPIVINISQSLYQVVIKDDDIQCYRFRVGENYTQISPQIYRDGHKLSQRLKMHIARNKLFIEGVD